ncbi:MAG TPA: hypothetical protein ENI62_15705 [Gammaproteobacteria bacterium]|nr:hypothetical protein [Gammaproteobacteria bacterium]
MLVIVTENIPARLRGRLAVWTFPAHAGMNRLPLKSIPILGQPPRRSPDRIVLVIC